MSTKEKLESLSAACGEVIKSAGGGSPTISLREMGVGEFGEHASAEIAAAASAERVERVARMAVLQAAAAIMSAADESGVKKANVPVLGETGSASLDGAVGAALSLAKSAQEVEGSGDDDATAAGDAGSEDGDTGADAGADETDVSKGGADGDGWGSDLNNLTDDE